MTLPVARSKIDKFEDALLAHPERIVASDMKVNHYLTGNGLYAREIILPAGTVVTGKIKKHEHISVISEGFVTEVTEAGLQRIKAPYTMVSEPGTKRIVWAHTDTVWVTIHSTTKTDLADIESELIAKTYEEVDSLLEDLQ